MARIRFEEQQHFTQAWLWILLLGLAGLFGWGFVQQIVLGHPWGTRPAPDGALWAVLGFGVVGLPLFFLSLRLDTLVTDDSVRVRLRPFRWRTISLSSIRSATARRYRPIREYGGWGIRYAFRKGWAYNVKGNEGVQLDLGPTKPVLIGSQRAGALADAINAARAD